MARVSVVMPCYNTERLVAQAIQSVLDQGYQDFEIIVVDDGSTDRSAEVIASFGDSRIRYLKQKNGGPANTRNTGIRSATGEFLSFLDADDMMLPQRLATQIGILENDPGLSVVGSGYIWVDEQGRELPWPHHSWQATPDLNDIASWLFDCPFVPSAVSMRRQACEDVGGFDEDLVGPEDWNFWMRLVVTGHRMAWHPEVLCLYRRSAGSLSEDAKRMSANCPEALQRVLDRPDFPSNLLPLGRKALAIRYIDGAKRLYRSGLWEDGKADLGQAIALDPELIMSPGPYPSRIEDEIVSDSVDPLVKDTIEFLTTVFHYLPDNAGPLMSRREQVLARGYLEVLTRGLARREYGLIARHWLPAVLRHPGWFINRGVWSIVLRYVMNRLHDLRVALRKKIGQPG